MTLSGASERTQRAAGGPHGLTLLALLLVTIPALVGCSESNEPYVEVGGRRIYVEIADSPEERAEGLMFRSSLPEDHGMLFVFPAPQILSFWMKNTSIPLSIAYIDPGGTILEIHRMEPYSLESITSRKPALYALEVNQGLFASLGVEPGDRITLPANLSARQ